MKDATIKGLPTSSRAIAYSFSLFFFSFKLLLPLFTPSLPGSLPSVCLWARGAGCYLDDLVQGGDREFISCLPSGLCYLWCFNAILLKKNKIPHSSVEKHSSSKGEGSPCASGPGFKSSEWLWTFGPVMPTAQQGRWISIPRHDGNGLQRSAGYGEIWPQRACNALQHVHPNPQCHDVWDHGGPTWSWMPAGGLSWMRVCFLMCCIEALFISCTILWRRKICLSCTLFWKDDLINRNSSATYN